MWVPLSEAIKKSKGRELTCPVSFGPGNDLRWTVMLLSPPHRGGIQAQRGRELVQNQSGQWRSWAPNMVL